jgi:hypothetical protein
MEFSRRAKINFLETRPLVPRTTADRAIMARHAQELGYLTDHKLPKIPSLYGAVSN